MTPAVVKQDEYPLAEGQDDLRDFQEDQPEGEPKLRSFENSLECKDSYYFTIEEVRFCSTLSFGELRYASPDELDSDSQLVLPDLIERQIMPQFHAETILKAIGWWKLRFLTTYRS